MEERRVITKEQGLQFQKDNGFDLFKEYSAKTGFNAENIFVEEGKLLYEDYYKNVERKDNKFKELKKCKIFNISF